MKVLEKIAFLFLFTTILASGLFFMAEFGKISRKAADEMARHLLDLQGEYYE